MDLGDDPTLHAICLQEVSMSKRQSDALPTSLLLPEVNCRAQLPGPTEKGWVPDLTEDGDVESQPGPRTRALKSLAALNFLSLNTGGGPGAWRLLQDLPPLNYHVVAMQEVSFNRKDMQVFAAAASRQGWVPYFTLGHECQRPGDDVRTGGVVTLVRKGIKSSSWTHPHPKGGEMVCTQIGSLIFLNL